jgi:hypothetical protein
MQEVHLPIELADRHCHMVHPETDDTPTPVGSPTWETKATDSPSSVGSGRLTKQDRRLERRIVAALSVRDNTFKRPSAVELARRAQISLRTLQDQQRFIDALNRLVDRGTIAHDPTCVRQGFFCMPSEVDKIKALAKRNRIIRPVY